MRSGRFFLATLIAAGCAVSAAGQPISPRARWFHPSPSAPVAAAASQPTSVPANAESSSPMAGAAAASPATQPAFNPKEACIRFQFDGMEYGDVIRYFCQACNKPLMGDLDISGGLTFYDAQPYTYEQAMDALNLILEMRGRRLVEQGRYLRLIKLTDLGKQDTRIIRVGQEKVLDSLRDGEVVTAMLALKYLDVDRAIQTIKPMASSFAQLAPLGRGVLIMDSAASIQRIRQMLAAIDTEDLADRQFKSVPLKHASAKAVCDAVNKLMGGARRGGGEGGGGGASSGFTAMSDDRVNAVLLMGPADRIAAAENVIAQMDQADVAAAQAGETHIIALRNASALSVAEIIRGGLSLDKANRVVADPATNQLVVSAPPDKVAQVEAIVQQLDQKGVEGGVKVFPLKSADAKTLAKVISDSFRRVDAKGKPVALLSVSAEPNNNSLVIAGPATEMQMVAALIAQIDSDTAPGKVEVRTYQLANADARTIARSLARLFAPQRVAREGASRQPQGPGQGQNPRGGSADGFEPRFEADETSNQLMVAATTAMFPAIEKVIQDLQAATTLAIQTKTFELKYARADEISAMLQAMLAGDTGGAAGVGGGRGRRGGEPQPQPPDGQAAQSVVQSVIRISALASANSVVVQGPPSKIELAAELIRTFDTPESAGQSSIHIVKLQNADAQQLATTLKGMLPPAGRGGVPDVYIQPDVLTNSVLLRASAAQRKMLEEMISQLDEATKDTARETRILPLKHTSASALATMLKELYRPSAGSSSSGRRGRVDPSGGSSAAGASTASAQDVIITAAPGDSTLVIDAPRAKIEEISQLVASLDTDQAPGTVQVRTYQLAAAKAKDLAKSLERLFSQGASSSGSGRRSYSSGGNSGGNANAANVPQPKFEADAMTNQLMVAATAMQFEEIEKVIQEMEKKTVTANLTKTFQLKHANASDVAKLLTDVLGEDQMGRRMSYFFGGGQQDGGDIRISSLPSANAVVVMGSPGKLAIAEQLIQTFDTEDASGRIVLEVVQLKNAQAQTLATAVSAMLGSSSGSSGRSRGFSSFFFGGSSASTPQKEQVVVTAEPNSNSLLVRGPALDVPGVVEMIHKLDGQSTNGTVQIRVFPLANGEAATLAKSLERLVKDSLKSQSQGAKGGAAAPFSVAADDRTNSLVVSTTTAYFALVEEVLKSLDKAPERPERDVAYIWLQNADAYQVGNQLRDMYKDARGADKPVIEDDWVSNTLTIIAKDGDLKAMQAIIAKLDLAAKDTSLHVRVIPVTQAKARVMAEMLQKLYAQMGKSKVVLTNRIVTEEPAASSPAPARSLFENAGVEGAAPTSAPSTAPAAEAAVQEPPVTIAVDEATNSLIVSATGKELEEISVLIDKLLAGGQQGEPDFKVFKVTQADPVAVAATLDALFNPKATQQPQQNQQGAPRQQGGNKTQPQPRSPAQAMQVPAATPPKVVIVADSRTKNIIVRAQPIYFEMIESLIKELDQVATVISEVRVFTLKNTDATEVAGNVRELLKMSGSSISSAGSGASGKGGASAPQAQRAEAVRKMLEIRGKNSVAQLDTAASVSVTPNKLTNSVVVAAPPDAMELIAQLIQELDQSAAIAKVSSVRLYPLKTAEVRPTVTALQEIFTAQAGRATGGSGRSGGAPAAQEQIVITGEEASRLVLVSAPAEKHELIAKVIQEIDSAQGEDQMSVKVYRIHYADATAVAPALTETLVGTTSRSGGGSRSGRGGFSSTPSGSSATAAGGVRISADRSSNSLVIRASQADHQKVTELLAEIDKAPTDQFALQTIRLTKADADQVAQVLRNLFGAMTTSSGSGRRGGSGSSSGAAVTQAVVIESDRASHLLMVRADEETFKKIEELAKNLDESSTGSATGIYVIPLESGNARDVAAMVDSIYRQQAQTARQANRPVNVLAISADERANAVVVAASQEVYQQVSELVKQVESMKPKRGTLRVLQLKYADPTEVNNAIQQLYGGTPTGASSAATPSSSGQRGGASRSGSYRTGGGSSAPVASSSAGGQVQTTVLVQQKSVLVSANDEEFETIQKLAESLDKAAEGVKKQVRVFVLVNATNVRVATALDTMYRNVAQRNLPEDQVSVTALPQTNAVVVAAAASKIEEIAHLIEQLDKKEVAPTLEFRIYPLENASPTKIMPMLRQMLAQVRQTRPGEPIDVQADERTRSVIVTGQGSTFEQVDKIIKTLDKAPANEAAEVLIIPLKRSDAARMALVLNEMLRPSATNQVTPQALALQEQIRRLRVRSAAAGEEAVPELDLNKPIKVTADPAKPQGSNSLVISSTSDNLKAMKAIVEILDTVPLGEDVKARLIHLQNADAVSTMQILREIFTQGQQLSGKPGTAQANAAEGATLTGRALVRPLNVSADLRTNTLIVSGLEESIALAELIVKDLDRQSGELVTEVRLFRLKYADAAKLAPSLQSVFTESAADPGAEGLRTQVTRLRSVLEKTQGHESKTAKGRAALTVRADATTNILIVAARADVMPLIADVVSTMDIPGAGSLNTVRFFPLEQADATRMQQVITSLYAGPNASLVRNEDKPTVAVDTRTNALIVSASESTFAMLQTLLKKMDEKIPVDMRDLRLVQLENADAPTMAVTLQKMMDARVERLATMGGKEAEALKTIIVSDERTNSLVVGGSPESYELVKDLAKQLDRTTPSLFGQVQIFELKHTNAGTLATNLKSLFDQRYAAAANPGVERQKPIIVADLRANCLMVSANVDDTAIFKTLLEKLDVELADPAVQLVVIPLKHNDAGAVGPMIQTLFTARLTSMTVPGQTPVPQDRVDVAAESLSNSLIVSASKENLAMIRALLAKVDVEPPDESGIVRMYPLKNSDAQRVATMLQTLVTQGLYKPGLVSAANNAVAKAREKVSIVPDVRTNVLIVSASKENFAVLDEIIKKIDGSEDFALLSDVQVFTLKRADATKLAPMLQQFFTAKQSAEQVGGGSVRSVPVVVVADPRTNTLLVAGSRESFKSIEQMMEKLDTAEVAAAGEFRIFPLKQATAAALQPIITQLFAQRVSRGQTKDPVTVLSDPRTNSLIIGAAPTEMGMAESLIRNLDTKPESGEQTVRVFALAKADAAKVAATIQSLYSPRTSGTTATTTTPSGGGSLQMTVDERMNAIIVAAGPADVERIGQLVQQLDQDTLAKVTEIRVISLDNADATELAAILTEALTSKLKAPTALSPNSQSVLQFITRTADGNEVIASALQQGVLITADKRSNALVIAAPVENMPFLEKLVKGLDSVTPRTAQIKVFALKNADATQMATVLTELFRLKAANGDTHSVRYTLVSDEKAAGAATATIGSAEQYALTVTVDLRTNSLLVGGTSHYISLVDKIIQELDSSPAQERQTQVVRLRNARGQDVQTALTSFLDNERQKLTTTLGQNAIGAAQRLLEREVSVVAVASDGVIANSNTLLISASPRYFQTISDMIKELDQPQPQVLIQVLLAEVRLDDRQELGIDWNYQKGQYDFGTRFGVKEAHSLTGGFSLAITSSDLTFFFRALEAQNKLEVLSRPQILAADNQEANITIGQRVPYITESRLTDNNAVINTVNYEDIGVILTVTPRINIDGFVKLHVKPEVSSIADSTVEINAGVKATVFDQRTAETTVNVQDGHTIVLGGLITTKEDNNESRVPILGDIPLVGLLFRSNKIVKERRELLIVLTPHVLKTNEAADVRANEEVEHLNKIRQEHNYNMENDLFAPFRGILPSRKDCPAVVPAGQAKPDIIPLDLLPELRQKEVIDGQIEGAEIKSGAAEQLKVNTPARPPENPPADKKPKDQAPGKPSGGQEAQGGEEW